MRCVGCNRRLVNEVQDPNHEEEKSHIAGLGAHCEKTPKARVTTRVLRKAS